MRKSKARLTIPAAVIKPLIKPIVKPVVERLDQHEDILRALQSAFDIQLTRIAQIQAQLDHLLGHHNLKPTERGPERRKLPRTAATRR